ncbi:MAG: VOC family protein [Pseudomonadota bacterium]
MVHRSRLGGISIDCQNADLIAARDFWAGVFGDACRQEPEETFVRLDPRAGLTIEVQRVDHPSRVHIDLETDDVSAEVARLEEIGAHVVAKVQNWVVMEAPTGHRFCVVPGGGREFDKLAKEWT